jgi:hypothetical protein
VSPDRSLLGSRITHPQWQKPVSVTSAERTDPVDVQPRTSVLEFGEHEPRPVRRGQFGLAQVPDQVSEPLRIDSSGLLGLPEGSGLVIN